MATTDELCKSCHNYIFFFTQKSSVCKTISIECKLVFLPHNLPILIITYFSYYDNFGRKLHHFYAFELLFISYKVPQSYLCFQRHIIRKNVILTLSLTTFQQH